MGLIKYTHPDTVYLENGEISFSIPQYDLDIVLPSVKRLSGTGASYVKKWTKLPQVLMDVIKQWQLSSLVSAAVSKPALRKVLAQHGVNIGEDPMNARMSELLGLNIVIMVENGKPRYLLNTDKVDKLLANGGALT